jgi:hypothetical protein
MDLLESRNWRKMDSLGGKVCDVCFECNAIDVPIE